jgi:very-short-patch-repair endonuclease
VLQVQSGVEVDGSQHGAPEGAAHDRLRTSYLEGRGWTILRFWNDDVLRDIDNVCQHIVIVAGMDGSTSMAFAETQPMETHP